jgi:hypothetical protein
MIATQKEDHLKLLVPRQRSLSTHFNLVKDAIRKAGG